MARGSSRSAPVPDAAPARRGLLRRRPKDGVPKKQGRLSQLRDVFRMTRRSDRALPWWMLLGFTGPVVLGYLVGLAIGHPWYLLVLAVPTGVLAATFILARRAERAAYAQIAGQPGATGAALSSLRRGWNVDQEPVAVDARTQDLVFRAVGRPGVVLVTEGPLPRVNRLAEAERKKTARLLPNVPVHVMHAGDGSDQVPLQKLSGKLGRMRPSLTKTEVSEVSRRLRALGGVRPPIPKGVDPTRVRPDRKAMRGR
ncbi:MAG: DUF4191 domain-containing protein [Kineosporiaceae bacterium]